MSSILGITGFGHVWATTGNLNLINQQSSVNKVEKRRIQFQPSVRVILIPSRTEYSDANMFNLLWWEDTDYTAFKSSAILELKALMSIKNIQDSKKALKMMYQPEFHFEDIVHSKVSKESTTVHRPTSVDSLSGSPPTIDESSSGNNMITRSISAPALRYNITPVSNNNNNNNTQSIETSETPTVSLTNQNLSEVKEIRHAHTSAHNDVAKLGLLMAKTDTDLSQAPSGSRSPKTTRTPHSSGSRAVSPSSSRSLSPNSSAVQGQKEVSRHTIHITKRPPSLNLSHSSIVHPLAYIVS